jgi:hypothetical protein
LGFVAAWSLSSLLLHAVRVRARVARVAAVVVRVRMVPPGMAGAGGAMIRHVEVW